MQPLFFPMVLVKQDISSNLHFIKPYGHYGPLVSQSHFQTLGSQSVISPLLMSSTSLSYGVATVAENGLMQKEFTSHQRATMGSLNSLAGSLLFGAAAIVVRFFACPSSHALVILEARSVV